MLRHLSVLLFVVVLLAPVESARGQSIVPRGAPEDVQERIPTFRIDTRALRQPIDVRAAGQPTASPRPQGPPDFAAPLNALRPGGTFDEGRVAANQTWPGVGATGWYPPDPDLAVGPNHILEVVNSTIAWFDKNSGTKQVQQTADTFFSSVAQTSFLFDPKCFYDRLHGRFVVLFAEESDPKQVSNVLIAVSDDSDPNGIWYRYRFNAKVMVNNKAFWLDYPGFGYTQDAYVVSGNMFGFTSGFAGVQFIVIPSTSLLSGAPASAASLIDSTGSSVQMAEVVDGASSFAFGVSRSGASSLRVYAIQSPGTLSPTATYTTVAVPSNSSPASGAQSTGGYMLDTIDGRVFNAVWRGNRLVTAHSTTPSTGAPVAVRWYEVNTGGWPVSGTPTLTQAGLIASSTINYFMPAINTNAHGDIALLFSASSSTITANIMAAGRQSGDPLGSMGQPIVLRTSDGTSYSQDRWGDYFGVDVDPGDDTTFWGAGEYVRADASWGTAIFGWSVTHTAPLAPGNLTAATASSSQINLTWTDTTNETSYSVERSTDSIPFATIVSNLGNDTTSYSDTNLAPSTKYYFRVQAHNSVGDSPYSNVANATTLTSSPTPPPAPSGLTAATTSRNSIALSWTDTATNEDGFKIEQSTNGKSWTQIGTNPANNPAFTATGLRSKTTYSYRVRAFNAAGNSVYSNTASATTLP